jgi:hypothetical protein
MLDPETVVEKLKLVAREMDVYRWYQEAGLGDAVRDAIVLIERMASSDTCSCSHCVICGAPKGEAKEAANG